MQKSAQELAIDAACLRMSIGENPSRAVATTISSGVVAWVLTTWESPARMGGWFALVVTINLARLSHALWFNRVERTDAEVMKQAPLYVVLMEAAALAWGVLIVWIGFPKETTEVSVILLTIAGMMASGAHGTSVTPRTMYASMAVSMTPGFIFLLVADGQHFKPLALLIVSHAIGVRAAVRAVNQKTRASIALRFENAELVEQLRVEKAEAEKANQEKSRFVAAASHDARQPLHAMGLLVDTLKAQTLEPKSARLVQSIDVAHASLVSLHEGLLELSVSEVGAVIPRLVDAPLRPLLETLQTECGARAKLRGLTLDVRAPNVTLRTDPSMLLRVLRNLVSNAITYTQKGRVLIAARKRSGSVLIQIWDTGIGMAPEHLPRIFDELYQVGNVARDRAQGLGLGLAIVKRLASALKTEVTVRSMLGKGSVFSIVLPLAVEAPRSEAVRQSGSVALVVDDDGLARNALATMLTHWGFEVVTASDAEEAREYAQALERLDVVVSDLWLPGASGLELLQGLSAKPGLKRVLMSGDTTAESEAKVRASGLTFVRKPVRGARLAEALSVAAPP
ncbi:MAG: response regulator [Archangium sp.]|nr:response regulator [Archangium sp.]